MAQTLNTWRRAFPQKSGLPAIIVVAELFYSFYDTLLDLN
jgi:hypothetical protein